MNQNEEEPRVRIVLSDSDKDTDDFIPLIADEDDEKLNKTEIPDLLPILPLKNTVLFPGVILPITVGRKKSLQLIRDAHKNNNVIGTLAQIDGNIEEPGIADLYKTGTLAKIIKVLEMPDDTTSVIIQGQKRIQIVELVATEPYHLARAVSLEDAKPLANDNEYEAIVGTLKDLSLKIIKLSSNIPPEASFAVKNIDNATFLVNFICSNTDIRVEEKQNLLEINSLKERAIRLLEHLSRELQMLELKKDIQLKVRAELDQQQREFLLNQQIKTIQEELGGNPLEQEINELKEKAKKMQWGKEVAKLFDREIAKLQRMNPAAGEYSVQLNYIETLLELPWEVYTKDKLDLKYAKQVLDEDHHGLEEVKERILEHLAVIKLKKDLKSPILCLYGPPGVGKTSLGKSIARALNRKYVRISLGGLHDESEIRGHRKTYVGAMPGRIIQNIRKAKSSNPVFVLDEIDKVGTDFRGDPSSALLEVLDPEQNNAFHDNYLEIEYDLSKVMFIATANTTVTISPALRDRMEMINVSGYIVEEKIEIANRHLIPKQLDANGLKKSQLVFSEDILSQIIADYTLESGVRKLEQKIAKISRFTAKKIALGEKYNKKLTATDLKVILGPPEFFHEKYEGNEYAGVVTGLAYTAAGGDILFIETSLSRGNGKLTITGNLGEVMKESAILALEYLKSHAAELDISTDVFEKWNVHLHVPEGAIPKDGPSAGITMITSIASAFTQRKVKKQLAMTGEITLRGKVLPVGGIKEKILAARRSNLKEIIMSKENFKDIDKIDEIYRKDIKFHFVDTIMDVLRIALLKQKVKNPVEINC
ncbi:MAG: endopeptidase La [Bacteroidota bacterium]